jgi:uncharacterized protein (TIGR03435 family)
MRKNLACLLLLATGGAALAQNSAPAASSAPPPFIYDVVSVKPYKPASESGTTMWWRYTKDGFSAQGIGLTQLMISAYGILTPDQIEGLPPWADSAEFAIDAKMDDDIAAAYAKLTRPDQKLALQQMMQAMLADRFALKAHHENRERPVYELVLAKSGSKLSATAGGTPGTFSMGNGMFRGKGVAIDTLVFSLSNQVGRTVVDKTGLTGKYDVDLKWTPDDLQGSEEKSADPGPSIFTAVEEQLGLKLVSAKGPVDTIVIDHIEKPSEN